MGRIIVVHTEVTLPEFLADARLVQGRTYVSMEDFCAHLTACAAACDHAGGIEDIGRFVRAIRDQLGEHATTSTGAFQ